ncbi:MAG: flavodoxin family protein [Methanomassiliicoccales archaeon]|nr:flavodoxin family protein [Methanomassiliicoccales archaeon]
MKILVMYDSIYGNTERMAKAITEGLKEKGHEVECRHQSVSGEEDFMGAKLWVLGSPTRWGRATFRFRTLVLNAVKEAGTDHDFVTFDTRYENMHYGAADRLSQLLTKKGLRMLLPPEHFIMDGNELRPDQEERARQYGRSIASML